MGSSGDGDLAKPAPGGAPELVQDSERAAVRA